jgi:hypothetical protein
MTETGINRNDRDRDKQEYSEKNLSFCLFVHHSSYMDWPRIEHDPPP